MQLAFTKRGRSGQLLPLPPPHLHWIKDVFPGSGRDRGHFQNDNESGNLDQDVPPLLCSSLVSPTSVTAALLWAGAAPPRVLRALLGATI